MSIQITKEVIFASEAATLLCMSTQRIYKLIHTGILPAYKDEDSRTWKIPVSSLENYIKNRKAILLDQFPQKRGKAPC